MGTKHLRTLREVEHHGFWLEAKCPACGRAATFKPRDLIKVMRPPHDLRSVARRLVCHDPPGCGHRGALVKAADAIVTPAKETVQPVMTTDRLPAGVDAAQWLKADWHQRQRLIRAARNR